MGFSEEALLIFPVEAVAQCITNERVSRVGTWNVVSHIVSECHNHHARVILTCVLWPNDFSLSLWFPTMNDKWIVTNKRSILCKPESLKKCHNVCPTKNIFPQPSHNETNTERSKRVSSPQHLSLPMCCNSYYKHMGAGQAQRVNLLVFPDFDVLKKALPVIWIEVLGLLLPDHNTSLHWIA